MKMDGVRVFMGLMMLGSATVSQAGKIQSAGGQRTLSTRCLESKMEQACSIQAILLTDHETGEVQEIAHFRVDSEMGISPPFHLKSDLKRFKAFPVSTRAYSPKSRFGRMHGLADSALTGLPVGFGIARIGGLDAGVYLFYAGLLITIAPVVADLAALPIRAVVRLVKVKKRRLEESLGLKALLVLLQHDDSEPWIVSEFDFGRLIQTLKMGLAGSEF